MTVDAQYALSEFAGVCFCSWKKKKRGQLCGDGDIDNCNIISDKYSVPLVNPLVRAPSVYHDAGSSGYTEGRQSRKEARSPASPWDSD